MRACRRLIGEITEEGTVARWLGKKSREPRADLGRTHVGVDEEKRDQIWRQVRAHLGGETLILSRSRRPVGQLDEQVGGRKRLSGGTESIRLDNACLRPHQ